MNLKKLFKTTSLKKDFTNSAHNFHAVWVGIVVFVLSALLVFAVTHYFLFMSLNRETIGDGSVSAPRITLIKEEKLSAIADYLKQKEEIRNKLMEEGITVSDPSR